MMNKRMRSVVFALAMSFGAAVSHAAFPDITFKLKDNSADFGTGAHVLGAPSGDAYIAIGWVPNIYGNMMPSVVVLGTLYHDASGPGCSFLKIEFQQGFGSTIATRLLQACGPGGNANDPVNQLGVNESYANTGLTGVVFSAFTVFQDQSGTGPNTGVVLGDSYYAELPDERVHDGIKIDSGNADLGKGNHSFGGPSEGAWIRFRRTVLDDAPWAVVRAEVVGTLYWDNLFSGGCARLVIDFQNKGGGRLRQRIVDKCGTGGDANNSANHRAFFRSFESARLWKVRLRVGSMVGGQFVGVKSDTVTFEPP